MCGVVALPECPGCGAEHDPRRCAGTCDCCSALYPNEDAWLAACEAIDAAGECA